MCVPLNGRHKEHDALTQRSVDQVERPRCASPEHGGGVVQMIFARVCD